MLKITIDSTSVIPYYLFFDTETTGVPRDYNAPASNTRNWPRLVQLGWIVTDEEGNVLSQGNEIVKPEGFVIPADAARVHGITTERAQREGKPLREVIEAFLKDAEHTKCIVGHNISFDQKVVGAELYRLGIPDTISTAKSLCTMQAGTDYCKIPGYYGYKWPKLQELHHKLFGCDFEDAHDAMADITATKKCFFEMRKRGLI
jgi:DNA polymerase III epsilon subunit-like protein